MMHLYLLLAQLTFDSTITLGDVLKIVFIVGSFVWAAHKFDLRLTLVEKDVKQIKDDLKAFKEFWGKILQDGWVAKFEPEQGQHKHHKATS